MFITLLPASHSQTWKKRWFCLHEPVEHADSSGVHMQGALLVYHAAPGKVRARGRGVCVCVGDGIVHILKGLDESEGGEGGECVREAPKLRGSERQRIRQSTSSTVIRKRPNERQTHPTLKMTRGRHSFQTNTMPPQSSLPLLSLDPHPLRSAFAGCNPHLRLPGGGRAWRTAGTFRL